MTLIRILRPTLIAGKPFNPGDVLNAADDIASSLVMMRKAKREPKSEPPKPEPPKAPEPKAKR